MRRWFATVRVRTTVFATLVVTAALDRRRDRAPLRAAARARGRTSSRAPAAARPTSPASRSGGRSRPTLTAAKEDDAFTQVVDANGPGDRGEREPPAKLGVTHAVLPPSNAHGRDHVHHPAARRAVPGRHPPRRHRRPVGVIGLRRRLARDGGRRDRAAGVAPGRRPAAARRPRRGDDVVGDRPGDATGGGDPVGGERDRRAASCTAGCRNRPPTTRWAGSPGR